MLMYYLEDMQVLELSANEGPTCNAWACHDQSAVLLVRQLINEDCKVNDAVETHSCVDASTDKKFLSMTQLLMINQLQDVST